MLEATNHRTGLQTMMYFDYKLCPYISNTKLRLCMDQAKRLVKA